MEAITSAICASAPGRPQMTSSNPEIIRFHRVRPPALSCSIRARRSASLHGIFGPPVSTWSTPICFRRRIPGSSTGPPKPRQIFGVSLLSAGIRENAGAASPERRGSDPRAAEVPIALRTLRRLKSGRISCSPSFADLQDRVLSVVLVGALVRDLQPKHVASRTEAGQGNRADGGDALRGVEPLLAVPGDGPAVFQETIAREHRRLAGGGRLRRPGR